VDLISDKSGWCVNSIQYKEIKWTTPKKLQSIWCPNCLWIESKIS
jgi:hypothetical protein